MTKPWDDVREEIVQLISDGASLEHVRARLSKERKFDASIRSYRKKLKQWKLTRHGQFEIQKSSVVSSSDTTGPIPTISLSSEAGGPATDRFPSPSVNDDHSRNGSISGSSLYAEQYPTPASATSPSTNQRQALSPSDANRTASFQLDVTFESLKRAENGPTMFDILKRLDSPFASGRHTILHYAVSQTNFWVVDCILDFMLSQNMDVDVTDNNGLTALETAIMSEKKENVESLLRADAAVDRWHPKEGQPLHRAAAHTYSADICRVLLFHHPHPNELQHKDGKEGPTPLRILVDRALDLERGAEKDRVSAMIEVLLEYGGRVSEGKDPYDHNSAILDFLDRWTRWGVPNEGRHSRGFYLGHYFRADCSPLCWFPARHCAECHSMASYVFSHTRRHLGRLLIQSSNMEKFGLQLAERIINPCPNRLWEKADRLSDLLETLLKKCTEEGRGGKWDYQLVNEVLEKSPAREQVALLKTLVDCKVVLNSDLRRTFGTLSEIADNQLRLQLAELLLEPHAGVVQKETHEKLMRLYLDIYDTASNPQHLQHELRMTFEVEVLKVVEMQPDFVNKERRDKILQCVVHGLTRFLMTDTTTTIPGRYRIEAFRLRDLYELPALLVSSKSVMGLLRPSTSRSSSDVIGRRRQSTAGSIEMTDTNDDT